MKKLKFGLLLASLGIVLSFAVVFFISCQKEKDKLSSNASGNPNGSQKWSITNKEHLAVIDTTTNDYKASILEALKEKKSNLKSSNNSDAYATANRIKELFQQKCSKRIEQQNLLKSATTESFKMDSAKLQGYMEKLSGKLSSDVELIGENSDITKDSFLTRQNKVINDFNEEISNDNSLSADEKQVVIETSVLKTNIVSLTINYGEEIIDNSTQLKSLMRCNWWCKIKKIATCTSLSVTAGGTCYGAYQALVNYWLWAQCVSATIAAVDCWASM
jgi:hypothetical protein